MAQAVTWEQIRDRRNELELAPITVGGRTFDCDKDSLERMRMAIAAFDSLPTLQAGKLAWKLHDNSFALFTKPELQTTYDAIVRQMAIRGALNFVTAETLRAQLPNLTRADLEQALPLTTTI